MIQALRLSLQCTLIIVCLWITAASLVYGQQSASSSGSTIQTHSLGDSQPKPWTSLNISRSERDFQFAIVSDNAGTPRPGIWREAMNKINLLQPAFVMSVGDLIEGYVDSAEQLNKQWDGFLSDLSPLQLPFFFVAGNHDVGRPLWYDIYRQRIGPTWYYFIYQDVLFLILDTNDGPEHATGMSDQQLAWIEEVLKKHPATSVRWTMVFQHKPLWNENNPQWLRIRKMLADRQKATVMAGHIHEYMATQIDGLEHVALATTGGGSPLRGKDAGELDHITWVTMKDDGPTVANLQLDGILPIGFRTNESAKRYDEIAKGKFIQIKPVHASAEVFESANSPMTIKNPDGEPLRVKILFEPQNGVIVKPAAISTTLPPKSQATYDLKIEAENAIPIAQMQPIGIHWQAAQDRPEKESLQLSGLNRIFIDGKRMIPKSTAKVIDGQLDDWPELSNLVEMPAEIHTNLQAWRGVDDAKYRWAVAADDKFLYFAIDVFDDQIDHHGDMVWQDFAGVFVNPVLRSDAKPEDIKKEAFAVMAGLSMSADDQRRYRFGTPPEQVQSSVKQVANRILYEFAIPTDRFNEIQGGRWSQLQLNVIVNDHDANDQREGICVMYWRPRWDGMFHYPTSGIFERQ